jgi:hypothetical protein
MIQLGGWHVPGHKIIKPNLKKQRSPLVGPKIFLENN